MKFGLYPRLALAGIRKNKRLYIPYLLTCTIERISEPYIVWGTVFVQTKRHSLP